MRRPVALPYRSRLFLGAALLCFSACGDPVPPFSASPDRDTLSLSIESGSFFESPEQEKHRLEQSTAQRIAQSLGKFEGVEEASAHITLADTSILRKSPQTKSRAAVLVVRAQGGHPNESDIRDFVTAAVPNLSPQDLQLTFTASKAPREKIVDVGFLRVSAGSAFPLKITLAVLLGIALMTAVALIWAGVVIRRMKRTTYRSIGNA